MIRVAINGVAGRMGRELVAACARDDALTLVAAFDSPGGVAIGRDAGTLGDGADLGVSVTGADQRGDAAFDVLVDFTRPAACLDALELCVEHGAAMVIGSTGFEEDQVKRLDRAATQIAIVRAPNFSAGVCLTMKLIETAAKALGDSVDIEVLEAHHRHKVDAPSGTALGMGAVLAEATGRTLEDSAVYARHGHTGARHRHSIGFQSLRGGDIVGEHTVLFAGDGERLEITHRASSRQTFAGGAMRAAAWAAKQSPGCYDMNDVLGIAAVD